MWLFRKDFQKLKSKRKYPALIKALAKDTWRDEASRALVECGIEALPALLYSFSNSSEPHQDTVLSIIERMGKPIIAPLATYLDAANKDTRAFAVACLARIGAEEVVPLLVKLLADRSLKVVTNTCWSLFILGDKEQIQKAAEVLKNAWLSTCPRVVSFLKQDPIRTRYYKYGFVRALKHPQPLIRTRAAAVLGATGDESVCPYLLDVLDDPDGFVRIQVGLALIDLFGSEGINDLRARLFAEKSALVRKVLETLIECTNKAPHS